MLCILSIHDIRMIPDTSAGKPLSQYGDTYCNSLVPVATNCWIAMTTLYAYVARQLHALYHRRGGCMAIIALKPKGTKHTRDEAQ